MRIFLATVFVFFLLPNLYGKCGSQNFFDLSSATVLKIESQQMMLLDGCGFTVGKIWVRMSNNTRTIPADKVRILSDELAVAQIPFVDVIPTFISVGAPYLSSRAVPLEDWPDNSPMPSFMGIGLVSGVSFKPESLLPGAVASLFGENFSNLIQAADSLCCTYILPKMLAGVEVFYDDGHVGLFYAGPNQINFLVPLEAYELDVRYVSVVITGPDGLKYFVDEAPLQTLPTTPRTFMYSEGYGLKPVVVDNDWNLVNNDNPLNPSEYFVVIMTGLGKVEPHVQSGHLAPFEPLARTVNDFVLTVNGIKVEVLYAGLMPGFAGVYQVNAQMPDSVGLGNVKVEVVAKNQVPSEKSSFVLPVANPKLIRE